VSSTVASVSEHEILDAENPDRPRVRNRLAERVRHLRATVQRYRHKRRRWPTVLVIAVGALALTVIVATVGAGWLVQRSFPQTSGELVLPGLDAEVEVLRDRLGIPTIVADTSHDLFFAQGFVHAQDRFWEMDVRRHITAGRLSEMFGSSQVETDEFVRTLGWRQVAEQELQLLSDETLAALQAYADGVNAYLADRPATEVSLEYAALRLTARDYEIESWTPADSVSWLKAMAWDLRANIEEETGRALVGASIGVRVNDLYPRYPYDRHRPIVTAGSVVDGEWVPGNSSTGEDSDSRTATKGASPALRPPALVVSGLDDVRSGVRKLDEWLGAYGPGVGSNSFAVTGERSASGGALLANDPHLAPSLPGIWYQANLQCREVGATCPYAVSGFTFSGVPGVIIGHNDTIAWGFTNNGVDVMDLAYEALNDERYVRGSRLEPLDVSTETIEVAGGDPVEVDIRATEWGPLVSDVGDQQRELTEQAFNPASLPGQADEVAVALRWTALTPGRTADAILALNKASNFEEFRTAAAFFEVPSQNMLYADVDGHIGYQMPGMVPVRPEANDGTVPVNGWDESNRWFGYIPFSELPWVFDPPEQYIVAANQAVVDDYPRVLTKDPSYGYRSQRLVDLIEESPPLTPDSAADLMTDTFNPFAATLVSELFDLDEELVNADALRARELLADWDFRQDTDSAAAAFYNAVWRNVLASTFHDELAGDQRPDGGERWFEVMTNIIASASGQWWDDGRTEVVELRDEILAEAMNDATTELTDELGDDPAEWRWGNLHQLELTHGTLGSSDVPPLEAVFNRGPFETGGGDGIVNATGWAPYEGFGVTWVPSMRMVVDLDDLDASRWVQLTGQSGHAFDPHYTDQTEAWAAGDTYQWVFTMDASRATTEDTLTLTPTE
jgi:penicillin amidase